MLYIYNNIIYNMYIYLYICPRPNSLAVHPQTHHPPLGTPLGATRNAGASAIPRSRTPCPSLDARRRW